MRRNVYYFIFCWTLTAVFSEIILLNTTQDVEVDCNESIILQCSITSPEPGKVLNFYWKKLNTTRQTCNSTESKSVTCMIPRAKQEDAGVYVCALEAYKGHGDKMTTVKVRGCKKNTPTLSPLTTSRNYSIENNLTWILLLLSFTFIIF